MEIMWDATPSEYDPTKGDFVYELSEDGKTLTIRVNGVDSGESLRGRDC